MERAGGYRYWTWDRDVPFSLAAARVGVGLSFLWMWTMLAPRVLEQAQSTYFYEATGVLQLLPWKFSPWLTWLLVIVGVGAATLTVVGLFCRISFAVAWLSFLFAATFTEGFAANWSHLYNVGALVSLPLLFANTGAAWSVDKILNRQVGGSTQMRAVFAMQAMFGAILLSAWLWKVVAGGGGSLDWALSDNLRHQLIVQYEWGGTGHTALGDWLLASEWRYKLAACGNLLAQLAPFLLLFFLKRTWLRWCVVLLLAIEFVGFKYVMGLAGPTSWLPLLLIYPDWDKLVTWWSQRRGVAKQVEPTRSHRNRAVSYFVLGVVLLQFAVGLAGQIDIRLQCYPFSSFPMFSKVRAQKPYDQHLPYFMFGMAAYVDGKRDAKLSRLVRKEWRARSRKQRQRLLKRVAARVPNRDVRIDYTLFWARPYPASATFDQRPIGVLAERVSGRNKMLVGAVKREGGRRQVKVTPAVTASGEVHFIAADERLPVTSDKGVVSFSCEHRGEWTLVLVDSGATYFVASGRC